MLPPIDRHRRLRAVFDEALLLDADARETYLDDACAGDAELRSDVTRLLAMHQEARSFLEHPLELLSAAGNAAQFAGTDRFAVVRPLGAGGMGVVYEAHDRHRDEVVALKTLRRSSAADLYRLKREFRSLADITHPNLVCLYELFVEEQQSFFTMELVRGVSFVDYVRGSERADLSLDRLMPALRQLVEGVSELHHKGKLHCDIKPSNVLVTPAGRVVILDFGLIAEAGRVRAGETTGGTPAYMSPEEVSGAAPSEASDWYGVGVTMYEALTGVLPFSGSVADVLFRKRTLTPPAPAELAPGAVPPELSAICMGLLDRAPDRRLNAVLALRALFGDGAATMPERVATAPETPFVGRRRQLQALDEAHAAVLEGDARSVAIYGPSGIGKSALVREFLGQFAERDEIVVLAGRCYENESVPYKALDGVVDDLSRYLNSIAADRIEALLSAEASALSALTKVFPVLLQVDALSSAPEELETDRVDPFRVRRRAFEALGALLARLAEQRTLVIWIDDLQWADADSAVLLEELLAPPSPPAMLTLLSFRQEELAAKPFLKSLLDRAGRHAWSAVSLEAMTEEEARSLIGGLLPDTAALTDDETRRLTREAGGSPFVLEQLALYAGAGAAAPHSSPTLASMFESRLDALSPGARDFLEALAICGRPMAPEVVCDACGVERDRRSLVTMLRASRFIRSSGSSDRVEAYHDRIREALAGRIDAGSRREIHARLAAALVARDSDDCEALFEHYRGAGDVEEASIQAGRAAERASAALAFDQAASFYQHALALAPSADAAQRWKEELAAALANASRPAEAAEAYLGAATGAERSRRVELQRRAAEQFLTGGHIDRGLDLIASVLESVGLRLASSPRIAAVRLFLRRARLGWRGLQYVPRPAEAVDPDALLRLDTCWATATGLGLVDVISASDFIAQHLHMALDAGEPSRIARGAALEWAARNADWPFRKSSAPLHQLATVLAERIGTAQAAAKVALAESVAACATGEWRRALTTSERALTILRDRCVGVTWELNIAQNTYIWALMYLGEIAEVCRVVPAILADARRRGNLYLATELCTRSNLVWLARDDPDDGEREAMDAIARWSEKGFHRQHYSARLARVQTALYRGDAPTAWRLLIAQESKLRSSMLTRVQAFRVESLYLRARCAIAVAASDPSRRRLLSVARASARRIARERMPWSDGLALLLQGGIAFVEGDRAAARSRLAAAIERFDRAEMKLYAGVTRRRLGVLQRDENLLRHADAWMASQQITNPAAFTRMLAPGFPDSES